MAISLDPPVQFKNINSAQIDKALLALDASDSDKKRWLAKENLGQVLEDLLRSQSYIAATQLLGTCLLEPVALQWVMQSLDNFYQDFMSDEDKKLYRLIKKIQSQDTNLDIDTLQTVIADLDHSLPIKWVFVLTLQYIDPDNQINAVDRGHMITLVLSEVSEYQKDQDNYFNNILINGIAHALGDTVPDTEVKK